jgi:hypothetical protein
MPIGSARSARNTRGLTTLTRSVIFQSNPWGGVGYDPPVWPPVGLGQVAGEKEG